MLWQADLSVNARLAANARLFFPGNAQAFKIFFSFWRKLAPYLRLALPVQPTAKAISIRSSVTDRNVRTAALGAKVL